VLIWENQIYTIKLQILNLSQRYGIFLFYVSLQFFSLNFKKGPRVHNSKYENNSPTRPQKNCLLIQKQIKHGKLTYFCYGKFCGYLIINLSQLIKWVLFWENQIHTIKGQLLNLWYISSIIIFEVWYISCTWNLTLVLLSLKFYFLYYSLANYFIDKGVQQPVSQVGWVINRTRTYQPVTCKPLRATSIT